MRWSGGSRSCRVEAALLAVSLVFLGSPLVAETVTALPTSAGSFSAASNISLTLYGNAIGGWGFNATNITNPGPHLFVAEGANVTLTLIATDTTHNWFIDLNNNDIPDANEQPYSSPDFSPANSIVFSFVANLAPGTYTYRCRFHPTTMTGLITFALRTQANITLYGDAIKGWGYDPNNITSPGPTLVIAEGVNVTLHLYTYDTTHNWFLSYTGSSTPTAGDLVSQDFKPGNPTNFSFQATRAGNFTYRCQYHPTTMKGTIAVLGSGGSGQGGGGWPLGLIPTMMVFVIVAVLVLAVVYQIRAVRAARGKARK